MNSSLHVRLSFTAVTVVWQPVSSVPLKLLSKSEILPQVSCKQENIREVYKAVQIQRYLNKQRRVLVAAVDSVQPSGSSADGICQKCSLQSNTVPAVIPMNP